VTIRAEIAERLPGGRTKCFAVCRNRSASAWVSIAVPILPRKAHKNTICLECQQSTWETTTGPRLCGGRTDSAAAGALGPPPRFFLGKQHRPMIATPTRKAAEECKLRVPPRYLPVRDGPLACGIVSSLF